jgi:hypothetical protein
MLRTVLTLTLAAALVVVLGAPPPAAASTGCPAGSVGSGEVLICPKSTFVHFDVCLF